MNTFVCAAFATLAISLMSPAADIVVSPNPYDGSDTLRYFLSKSTLVVVASVESVRPHSGSGPIYEPGVVKLAPCDHLTGITVERVLCGTRPKEKTFTIHLYQMGTQNGVCGIGVQEKQRYIFFLKPSDRTTRSTEESPPGTILRQETLAWQTADIWFGVFPFDTALEMKLSELQIQK